LNAVVRPPLDLDIDVAFLFDLLSALDMFLGDESPTQPPSSSSPCAEWWTFAYKVLTSNVSPSTAERWSCLYVVARRPGRHALLTDEQWLDVVRLPGASLSSSHGSGSLWLSGTGHLLRHRPALRALVVAHQVQVTSCLLDPKANDFVKRGTLEYIEGVAYLPGVARIIVDDPEVIEHRPWLRTSRAKVSPNGRRR